MTQEDFKRKLVVNILELGYEDPGEHQAKKHQHTHIGLPGAFISRCSRPSSC
jgi:hypothetical protein